MTYQVAETVRGKIDPRGVAVVAPPGTETITVTIPAAEQSVSILGERLSVVTLDGPDTFAAPGRPIAFISSATVEYRPRR